jgi:uncharacterized protein (DUF4213/DUF364 family)
MASTILSPGPHGHTQVHDVGYLDKKRIGELARLAYSEEPLEAGIGIAAINSMLEVDEASGQEINAAEVLMQRGRGKRVALVGHFPFIPELRSAAQELWVIEQTPSEGEYPSKAAAELLPRADVIAITGSALVNHTLDGLLELCPRDALVMLLGPSTPLSSVFFDHGVSIISGTRVIDEEAVLHTVSQGASFRQVKGVRLLTIAREHI